MKLKELQHRFVENLTMLQLDPEFLKEIVPAKQKTEHLVKCYQNNRKQALLKSLTSIYPVCLCLIGEDCFKALAAKFIMHAHSKYFNLNYFGYDFPEFLTQQTILQDLYYLQDLARLEWNIHQVMIDKDNTCFDFTAFSKLEESDFENIVFQLAENVRFFETSFAVDELWHFHQHDYPFQIQNERSFILESMDLKLLILRTGFDLSMIRLNENDRNLIEKIRQGCSLRELYNDFRVDSINNQQDPQNIQADKISQWIQCGLITRFKGRKNSI